MHYMPRMPGEVFMPVMIISRISHRNGQDDTTIVSQCMLLRHDKQSTARSITYIIACMLLGQKEHSYCTCLCRKSLCQTELGTSGPRLRSHAIAAGEGKWTMKRSLSDELAIDMSYW